MSSKNWFVEYSHVACVASASGAVLSDFSLPIAPGEIVVLLGESGAGQTTALHLANGLALPDKGTVTVAGVLTREWNGIELRRQIGMVSQKDGLFPHFSVAQNIGLVPELLGWERAKIETRTREMLELVNLPPDEFAGKFPSQLSPVERQRVSLARALAADQKILLLDNPFAHLDPLAREKLRDDFLQLCHALEKTAIFATSDLREALLIGDKIALLYAGQILFFGTPQEFALTDNPAAVAYRATMDLPAWSAPAQNESQTLEIVAEEEPAVEWKEPGLRAKLKRAGKRWKSAKL